MKLVKDVMTTRVATVEMDDTLKTVKQRFDSTGFHHFPVVDGDRLMGIISWRDLLKALIEDLDLKNPQPYPGIARVAGWAGPRYLRSA